MESDCWLVEVKSVIKTMPHQTPPVIALNISRLPLSPVACVEDADLSTTTQTGNEEVVLYPVSK